ncbi:wall-associated receptor kinase 2-like protein [Tanacetum coccineum]
MILHLMVPLLMMMLSRATTTSVDEITQALPHCPDKCGNVTIPYPFGTKKNCYMNKLFFVDCKKLQIWNTTFKVQAISNNGFMRGLLPVAYRCYNEQHEITNTSDARINLSRFYITNKHNVLTAVGCDARADIETLISQDYITGCSSMTHCRNLHNGACFGMGCSQAMIPYRMNTFRIHTSSNTDKVGKWGFNNCTYGFIVEKDRYNFNKRDIGTMRERTYPAVLEWWVGDDISCEKAKKMNNSYFCQENSVCMNILQGSKRKNLGYRCQCAQGYKGNAYLPDGCKDIDECAGQNECRYGCVNTKGGYNCSCPSGQEGDGWRNGTGCSNVIAVTSLPPDGGNISKIQYQGISMGIAASLVFTLILYCGLKQRTIIKSREMFFKKNGGLILQRLLFEAKQSNHMAKIFSARVLEKATDNFHKSNVIGEGGYGTVYKGTLEDKRNVAIKKSKSIDENQIEQFINEVIILSEISHPNVVKVLGCCLETHTPLLVYEFVTNKTVFNHLHDHRSSCSLTFERRLNIATQTAEALAYIHSTTQIIHRDIKSSNILLTDDYTAKVSDFGISNTSDQEFYWTDKEEVHGTLGYIDPEYFRSGILTEKSDVYSFGMFLVELLTGRKVFSHDGTESDLGLAIFFVSSLERGSLIHILDHLVKINGLSEHIKFVANLAKDCIELEGKKRPNMEEVKKKLKELRKSITDPGQLLLFYT